MTEPGAETALAQPQCANDITAVVVSYNSSEILGRCLDRLVYLPHRIVVDNASADDSVGLVRDGYPAVRLIVNERNLGFGAGVNSALPHVETTYLLTVSPDAELDAATLKAMYDELESNPGAGVVVPALDVPNRGREMWVMGPGEIRHYRADRMPDAAFCTWFASAAVALYRTDALRRIDGFDENIFLYNEDLDLSLRLTGAGYALVARPDLTARHINSGSAPPSAKLHWRKDWNFAWGDLYLQAKHRDRKAAVEAAKGILAKRLPKALFYAFTLDRKRLIRDGATAMGALAFLRGRIPRPRD